MKVSEENWNLNFKNKCLVKMVIFKKYQEKP
ncbi:hypothetical protein EV197_1005 [Aquimarina brevivitae]|uniref:Uncharacterized protein n=1 Tax=Aquimarina brevivitae TaxID=323412 RepID=A0A4V2F7G9_9FLAO|nr:hypothetical protein EV197_1005 [Aquimarina brevivitae]